MLTARSLLVKTISKVANNSSSAFVYTALQLRSSRQYSTNNSKSTHKFSNNKSTTQFLLNNYDNKYSKILSALYATQTTSKPSAPRTARRARAVVENVDVYTGRMRDAWKANVVTAIPFTFREMTAAGIEPNTETFEFLVLALIRLKRYEDAEIAYQSMQERKVEPSRDILFHMMKMYLILKDETRAMNMVSLIKERQFGIDIPMINALLTYYYTTKQSQGIAQTLEMMKAENVQPNQITLNLLMLIHNQQNNNEELQRVYQQFEQLGLYPDDVTLNVLAESRAKTGDVKGTYEIIDKLQAMNKKTSQRVYDALIKHYLKTDQKTKADELLYEVFVRKSQPTIETYRGYVDYYYSRDMTAHLLELMVDFQRNKIRADNDIYKKLVLAAARTNNLSAARDFFAQILDNGARPDNETWYTILEGIGNEGTIEEAIVFSGFMKQLNVPVTPALFNAFVKLYCRHGQPLAALNIAQMFPEHEPKLSNDNLDLILSTIMVDMQPFGEKVESVDLNNVTEMYNRIESITGPAPTVARVLAVWEYIKGEGIMADGRVYAHLIAAHGYERNADRVLSLLQEVIEHGITINAESALNMLKGIEHLQRGAEQVLDTLFKHLSEKDTAALSQEVLTKLIELYSNINRLDKAKHCWGMFAVLGKAPYRAAYQAMLDAYIASGSSGLHGSIMLAKQMTEEQSLKHTYPFNVQFFNDFFGYLAIHGAVEYLGTAMGWFKELSAYQKNNKYVTGEHGVLLVSYMRDLAVERAVPKELIDRNMNDLQEAYLNKSSVYRQLRDQLFDPVLTEFDKKLRDVPLQMDEAMRDLMYSISEEMKQPLEKLERNVTNPDVSESELLEDRFLQANAHQLLLGEERVRIRYNGENMEDMDEDMLAEEDVDEDVEDEEDEMDEDEVDEVDDSVDVAEERAKLEKIEQILKNLSGKK